MCIRDRARDADTIYEVPLLMYKEKLDETVLKKLKLDYSDEPELAAWRDFIARSKTPLYETRIGLVGKYNEIPDPYKSIYEAFIHAGAENECKVRVIPINSEHLIDKEVTEEKLQKLDGILVAPGFGERGIQGKLKAIKYVRENNIPFFGICLGMQCAAVEFANNVLGLDEAASTEVNPDTPAPIIHMMEDQKTIKKKGGTMRLGAYACEILQSTKAFAAYNSTSISERHRHRFEFNNFYLDKMEDAGMKAVGKNLENNLVEIIELENHPWFVGVQFHPELKSTVENPHPLFVNFVKACLDNKKKPTDEAVKKAVTNF